MGMEVPKENLRTTIYKNNEGKSFGEVKRKLSEVDDPQLKSEVPCTLTQGKINNNAFYGKFGEDIIKKGKNAIFCTREWRYCI